MRKDSHTVSQYKEAGVDIDAAAAAVQLMRSAIRDSYTPDVLADVGSFGGLFKLSNLPPNPVLVASTDGVGTKVELVVKTGNVRSLGFDIVHHCVNDILVQNARPLFFLDYVATSKLIPELAAEVVIGIAEACKGVGCALLGGELAEMPGVYAPGALDLVGTVVGLVDGTRILPVPENMSAGDVLIGLPSSGPHTNGYSLIRHLIHDRDLSMTFSRDRTTLGEALTAPHRCYLSDVARLMQNQIKVHGLAHITGGGLYDNIPRILPVQLKAEITLAHDRIPALFQQLWTWSEMDLEEVFRVWNMGIGMVVVVPQEMVDATIAQLPSAVQIGHLVEAHPSDPRVTITLET